MSKMFWEALPNMTPEVREKLAAHARKMKRPDMAEAIIRGTPPEWARRLPPSPPEE
jgi:hypothetical protein